MTARGFLKTKYDNKPLGEIVANMTALQVEEAMEEYAEMVAKNCTIPHVSGSCSQLIADIEKLSRYDIYGTETEGSVEVEHCNDGDNIDAYELYKILDNYR